MSEASKKRKGKDKKGDEARQVYTRGIPPPIIVKEEFTSI